MIDDELSPRERRYQRTQQAILTAARQLLTEGGVDKLSIRAIADRIDYSPAGLYEYYGSKEEIIGALAMQGHRMLKRYMERVSLTLPSDQYMVEIGMAYIQFAIQNPDYFLLIFTSIVTRPSTDEQPPAPDSTEVRDEDSSFPLLLQGVQRAVDTGVVHFLTGLGLMETAYAFWAVVHGAAMLRVTHLSQLPMDFDQADKLMLAAFVRGMGSTE